MIRCAVTPHLEFVMQADQLIRRWRPASVASLIIMAMGTSGGGLTILLVNGCNDRLFFSPALGFVRTEGSTKFRPSVDAL